MPRISQIQTNFTAGELSPRLYGRTDIDRYANAAKRLLNAYPVVHGGASAAAAPVLQGHEDQREALAPDPVRGGRDAAYMLEVGDGYVRVHGAGGADLGVELATPYSEAMLADIDYGQGADTMFVAHPSVPIQRLRRFGACNLRPLSAPFTTTPFEEQGARPPADITLASAAVGVAPSS
jgi:hypothetical protein